MHTILSWPHHEKLVMSVTTVVIFLMMMADVPLDTPDLWLVIVFSAVVAGLAGVILGLVLTPVYIVLIIALEAVIAIVRRAVCFIQRRA